MCGMGGISVLVKASDSIHKGIVNCFRVKALDVLVNNYLRYPVCVRLSLN